jgi:hemerythrin-like domain-containing protein
MFQFRSNDLYKQLKDDHQRIQNVLTQIEQSTPEARPTLFMNLKRELVPHLMAEENAFYPMLKSNLRTHDAVLVSMEEHHIAIALVKEMDQMSVQDETWIAKATVLNSVVTNHIKYEESKMFSDATKAIPESNLKEVARTFQVEKEKQVASIGNR